MATQYTSILKLALPTQGELSGTWGDVVNDNITSMVEEAIAGRSVINSWAANSHTLTTADGLTSESRAAMLEFTDTGTALSGAATVICPTATKIYVCKNGAGQTVTVKTAAGTGVAIPNGETMFVFCDGTNVVQAVTSLTTLKVGTGIQVSTILDEDNMASDSATALATQQSIKAYVDAQITAQDFDFAGDTGTGAVDLDSQTFTVAGTANEIETSASGQTITIGLPTAIVVTTITTTNVQATNIKANDGTAAITIADSTGQVTVTDAVLTTADINGGTADNVTIGGSTAAAGSFTTLGASGTTSLGGALALTGNLDINTNKFNVTAADGNTLIAGTLGVTGDVDLNGGTIDGTVIGGTTAAAVTGTTIVANTSIEIAGTTTVSSILDEDNMASDSATALATQQSIKAYVDSQVGTVDTLAEILANGNTSGATDLVIDSGQVLTTNTINETTAASGVTIDSVLLKDDGVNATNLEITNLKANDGTSAGSIADSTGVVTLASSVLTTTDINAGTIDNTVIGGATPAAVTTSSLVATTADINAGTIDGTVIGGSSAAAGTFTSLTATSANVNGTVTADGLTLASEGDQIIIPTSNSGISGIITTGDTVYGNAFEFKNGNGIVLVSDTNDSGVSGTDATLIARGSSATKTALFDANGDVSLFENTGTTPKFFWDASAESLGIGTSSPSSYPVASDLVVDTGTDGGITIKSGTNNYGGIFFADGTTGNEQYRGFIQYNHNFTGTTDSLLLGTSATERMRIDSLGNVGIGTTSPSAKLSINGSASINGFDVGVIIGVGATNASSPYFVLGDQQGVALRGIHTGTFGRKALAFYTSNNIDSGNFDPEERMRIDSSGNVGIGTSSPNGKLTVSNGSGAHFEFFPENSTDTNLFMNYDRTSAAYQNLQTRAATHQFLIGDSEKMRIDASGNLLVGKTSTSGGIAGTVLASSGLVRLTADGIAVAEINRLTSDGSIVDFKKDGTTVGSIGTNSGLFIGSTYGNDAGIRFASDIIAPSTTTGANRDAAIDLGYSSSRFKDLYLSGGVYLGGTGAANKLDDYEEGTWTPTYQGSTTAGTGTYTFQHGSYTKVGNLVTVNGYFRSSAHTGAGVIDLTGLPFAAASGGDNYAVISVGDTFNLTISNDTYLTGYVTPGTTQIRLRQISTQTDTITANVNMDTAFDLLFTVTYRTA